MFKVALMYCTIHAPTGTSTYSGRLLKNTQIFTLKRGYDGGYLSLTLFKGKKESITPSKYWMTVLSLEYSYELILISNNGKE